MKKFRYTIVILLLLILAVGCSGTELTPTSPPPPAPTVTEVVKTATVALTIDGQPFMLDEVEALGTVEVEADGTTYSGVPIMVLLDAAGAAGADMLTLVASDGYSTEVVVEDMEDAGEISILTLDADGTLDAVLPGQSKGGWVKDTVEIRVSDGGDTVTPAKVTTEAETVLTIGGQPFTRDQADVDLDAEADAFYQTVFGIDYQGPSLAD